MELVTNFGPHDSVGEAKHQLDNLFMKDGSCINKYVMEFNCLATQVHRIKDKIAQVGKPPSLLELCTMAQGVNAHYWEHKLQISCQNKTAPAQKKPEGKSSTPPSDTALSMTLTPSKGKKAQ